MCREAAEYRFACAMVNPIWVSLARSVLAGTGIPVGVVVGFPLGASLSGTKRDESIALVRNGAMELDMVISVGLLKSGMNTLVQQDIRGVVEVGHEAGAIVKVILETCLLTMEEKIRGSELAIAAGADFLKTSTGFSTGGATAADIAILRGVAGGRMWSEGIGRHSHAGRCARDAGCRCESNWRQRGNQHCARAGRTLAAVTRTAALQWD